MTPSQALLERRRFGQTARRDAWWLQPLATSPALSALVVYGPWASCTVAGPRSR